MEKLYENIQKIWTLKGLSQQNVATELNLSQRHYGRIENGQVDVNYSLLCKLASILGVTVQNLTGMEEMLISDNINQSENDGHFIAYNATDIEAVTKLYDKIIQEKDEHINSLKQLFELKK